MDWRGEVMGDFTLADLNDSFLNVLDAAVLDGVISPREAFLFGMNQTLLKDWEDWEGVIDHISNESDSKRIKSGYQFDNKRTTKSLDAWWAEKRDSAGEPHWEDMGL
jgi:hypothetical protein